MNRTEEKRELRKKVKQAAPGISAAERAAASVKITERIRALPWWKSAETVMLYRSTDTEPDTESLCLLALSEGKGVLLPRCRSRTEMEAVPWRPETPLRKNAFGILEPEGPAFRGDPDLIVVPCVAATREGIRLGHGAGYYDRFLAEHPGNRICVCFEKMILDEIPEEETDIRIPLVVTECGLWES